MRRRDAASAIGGLIAICVAVFAIGGAPRWSQALVAALTLAALVPVVRSRRRMARVSPLIAVLGIAAVLTAVQLIPLPAALLELLHPQGAALRAEGEALTGTSAWGAATMDTPGTLRALVGFVTLLGIAIVALRLAVSQHGRYQLLSAVTLICGTTAGIVAIHETLGIYELYGLVEVKHSPHLIGPLLNLNHLGCLMAVGTVLGIGLAAYTQQAAWRRGLWLVCAMACGLVAVYTVSRGATLALLVGAGVTVGLLVAQRFSSSGPAMPRRLLTGSLPIAIVAACVVIVVVFASASGGGGRLAATSVSELDIPTSKFAAWKSAMTLLEDSPWIGVGRGGFESTFTRVHPTSGRLAFTHVENEYLQALVDWGIPGAILLGIATAWLAVTAIRRWRDGPLIAAAIGGLVVIAVQSNVDFGAELLGIAAPITVIAACVAYVPLREGQPAERTRALATRVGHLGLLAFGAVLLLTTATRSLDEDHEKLQGGATRDEIMASIERHPLDYYGYAVAAELGLRQNTSKSVELLNHALRLNPSHPGLHRLAARLLRRSGHAEQAAVEYAAALRYSPPRAQPKLLAEIVSEMPVEVAPKAIPTDGIDLGVTVASLAELGKPELVAAWLERVLAHRPDHTAACELILDRIRHGDATTASLAERRCARTLSDAASLHALAIALHAQKREEDLIRVLRDVEHATGPTDRKHDAWLLLCDAYRRNQRPDDALRCLRTLDAAPNLRVDLQTEVTSRIELIQLERRRNGTP